MDEKEMRYFSMFTGVGGFELGIERALHPKSQIQKHDSKQSSSNNSGNELERTSSSCVGFSETDKYASELLKNKFPRIKNYGDATKINPNKLPDFELLVGGFPCQAFSIAGKRKGFEDTRGTLFHEIVRVLEVKRPIYLLLENVKGLLNHDEGRTFATILASLSKLGYVIQWMVLNSKFFGVPQNRERVFIIGSLRGFTIPEILPLGYSGEKTNFDFTLTGQDIHGIATGLGANYAKGDNRPSNKSRRTRIEQQGTIRRLTPTECERLQGFPDGWTEGFSDTQRYKMMGNAVTVNVVQAIMEKFNA